MGMQPKYSLKHLDDDGLVEVRIVYRKPGGDPSDHAFEGAQALAAMLSLATATSAGLALATGNDELAAELKELWQAYRDGQGWCTCNGRAVHTHPERCDA